MKLFPTVTVAVCCAATALGQGVASEWDVRAMLSSLQTQAQHLKPVLDQIKPDAWVANGAQQTYVAQWKESEANLRYLQQTSEAFFKQPERLTLALDTYFRMQAVDLVLRSLAEGIRKYQNPAVAELVQGIVNENSGNRDKLREYIRQLAQEKEEEFQVVDREAQRCRGVLLKQPPAATHERKAK